MADKIKCSHILVKKQSEAIAILERLKKEKVLQIWLDNFLLTQVVERKEET
jgi:hypothetical protein